MRYVVNPADIVTHGTSTETDLLPQFRPNRIRGHNYLDVIPEAARAVVRAAIEEVRATHHQTIAYVWRPAPPYPPRVLYCTPGRRTGDVMIQVYEPEGAEGVDGRTDGRTDGRSTARAT